MRKNLDNSVIPKHYDLIINSEENEFHGTVTMLLHAGDPIKSFRFNCKMLTLKSLAVQQSTILKSSFGKIDDEFVEVNLDDFISGDFTLCIEYSGSYGRFDGFYKSKYNENDLFATQFEPTDARKAFPCFDQPDMKATFSISLKVPKEFIALSNESLISVQETETHKISRFKKTPKMSTYIVAWVVAKMDFIEINSSVPIRVYADKNEVEWGRYSLNIADKCLKFFEEYFEIKYPLSKVDLVAIPAFASGAMENWGLITFRKTSLLWNPEKSMLRSKKNIANTVCHELAHMWFGNLVTMKWWNDLWLNEGFATWASSLAMNSIDLVDWDVWTCFCAEDIEAGMLADCLKSTHEIAIEVKDPDEIDQIFDAISYNKGSSVIRMLESWLGPENFRKGLVKYLSEKAYSNAETSDLWNALNNFNNSEKSVSELMSSWIGQAGFPLIEVTETNENSIVLKQKRFTKGFEDKTGILWPIPLKIRWFSSEEFVEDFILDQKSMTIPKKAPAFKLNDDITGFYRVKYEIQNLFEKTLSNTNRMNLFSDLFEIGFAAQANLPFEFIKLLNEENVFEVLSAGLQGLSFLRSVFYDDEELQSQFKALIESVIESRVSKIDLKNPGENINEIAVASLLVSTAVNIGILSVDSDEIHQEFKRSYFFSLVDKDFEAVKEFYLTSNLPGVKESALVALGTTKDQSNFEKLISNLDFVQPQDFLYLTSSLGRNIKFRDQFAEFFMKNYSSVHEKIADPGMFRYSFEFSFSSIYSPKIQERVLAFIEQKRNDKSLTRAIDTVKNELDSVNEFRKKFLSGMKKTGDFSGSVPTRKTRRG